MTSQEERDARRKGLEELLVIYRQKRVELDDPIFDDLIKQVEEELADNQWLN